MAYIKAVRESISGVRLSYSTGVAKGKNRRSCDLRVKSYRIGWHTEGWMDGEQTSGGHKYKVIGRHCPHALYGLVSNTEVGRM